MKYMTNRISNPFMFLMRHSLELLFKLRIYQSGKKVCYTHNLKELLIQVGVKNGNDIIVRLTNLDCCSTGDRFRYPDSKSFNKKTILFFETCNNFIELYNSIKPEYFATIPILNNDKQQLAWEMTFHPNECCEIGLFATQYDNAVNYLLSTCEENNEIINHLYLPILFMIRHSLELKLKGALLEIGTIPKQETHNISELYKIFHDFIDSNAMFLIKQNRRLKDETDKLDNVLDIFQHLIHNLDKNSYMLRFPETKNGETIHLVNNNILCDTLQLYQNTDTFLCLAIPILKSTLA